MRYRPTDRQVKERLEELYIEDLEKGLESEALAHLLDNGAELLVEILRKDNLYKHSIMYSPSLCRLIENLTSLTKDVFIKCNEEEVRHQLILEKDGVYK